MGFDEVIDLSTDELGEGVHRITQGYGSDIVIDAIGGDILSDALVGRPSDSLSDDASFYVGIGPADRTSILGVRSDVSH